MQSRQFLELRQRQQLKLTPQLQQSIRFLQLSASELEVEIANALSENPLLEQEEEYATDGSDAVAVPADKLAAIVHDTERSSMWAMPSRRDDWDGGSDWPEPGQPDTLPQHLLRQLHVTRASLRDRALVTLLIEELDADGYLRTPLDEIQACLPRALGVAIDELRCALCLLQSFDPAGVGAPSLAQCLMLQLEQLAMSDRVEWRDVEPAVLACARDMVSNHLDMLASGNLIRLRRALSCSLDTLRSAHALLRRLEPRPGSAWAYVNADYIKPDVLIYKAKDGWHVALNPAVMPRLRVNLLYERWLHESHDRGPMQAHVQRAHGLIKSVNQRFDTVLRVARVIARRQQPFFEHGLQAMRPLVLRDIAQQLELHESTVSRATNRKYAQTPWGVIELKRFFGGALATGDGAVTSATAVRSLIGELVTDENPQKPLSDSRIAALLADRGVIIARRTVAKYRETAGIASASLRRTRASLK